MGPEINSTSPDVPTGQCRETCGCLVANVAVVDVRDRSAIIEDDDSLHGWTDGNRASQKLSESQPMKKTQCTGRDDRIGH